MPKHTKSERKARSARNTKPKDSKMLRKGFSTMEDSSKKRDKK